MIPVAPLEQPDPRQAKRRRAIRALVVVAAVAQLVIAVVLAVDNHPASQNRAVTLVAPAAESVPGAPAATTSTAPPVVVEAPVPTTAPPSPPPTTVPAGVVFGVIGAGPGGRARADLYDVAGNTWHSEADSQGRYRFDNLPPGRYQLVLSAENGSQTSVSKREVAVEPGQEIQQDYPAYGPTAPAPATTTTVPLVISQAATTTTTTAP